MFKNLEFKPSSFFISYNFKFKLHNFYEILNKFILSYNYNTK